MTKVYLLRSQGFQTERKKTGGTTTKKQPSIIVQATRMPKEREYSPNTNPPKKVKVLGV